MIKKLLLLLLFCACQEQNTQGLPYYNDPFFTPHWFNRTSASLNDFHKISPFKLINQYGDTINKLTVSGKIYVADFFFTSCPGICPKMTTNMGLLQKHFLNDPDVLLISHSVTPKKDSVAVLQEYAIKNGIVRGKWHLLTGDQSAIYALARQDYFVEEDLGLQKDATDFIHTENFVLVDQSGHIRGIYNGLKLTAIEELIHDIKQLKSERKSP